MSKVFPGFQDVRWLLASHKGAFLYVPMFVQTNLQNVETYYHSGGKKKKLQLANWLKEQRRSEVVLCSEGNQKLSVGSMSSCLYFPVGIMCFYKRWGLPKIKRTWPRWLHSYILRETLSTKKVKLLYHVHLEKCFHEYEAVNTGLCLLFYWPSCIYFSSF